MVQMEAARRSSPCDAFCILSVQRSYTVSEMVAIDRRIIRLTRYDGQVETTDGTLLKIEQLSIII